MRVGQLDGALITFDRPFGARPAGARDGRRRASSGLSQLDAVREDLAPQLEARSDEAGYKLIAWGDAGRDAEFSPNNRPLRPFRFADA